MTSHNSSPSLVKINRPALSTKIYPRRHLFRLMDRNIERKVCWVSGPAGAGKTTLVASFLSDRKIPTLWYQLDSGDSDPATFFHYLGLAVQKQSRRKRKTLPNLTQEYLSDTVKFAHYYFREFFEFFPAPFVLVLDDYHTVPAESKFHQIISEGLTETPAGMSVLITSREEPPRPFSRLQINQQMSFVDGEMLKLSKTETSGLLKTDKKVKLTKQDCEIVYERTAGWIAGVILALEHLKKGSPISLAFGKRTLDTVFHYFDFEVFEKEDAQQQNFLLKTSFLPKMTPFSAGQLSGELSAGAILSDLSKRHFFTMALPNDLYQYHDLFREYLQFKSRERFSNEELILIQRSAAKLLETEGRIEEAFNLYELSGDWEALVRIILKEAMSLAMTGRNQTLEAWINKLPGETIHQTPWLLYWLGSCRLSSDFKEGRELFEKAFKLFEISNDTNGLYLSWCGIVKSHIHSWDTLKPLDRWIEWLVKRQKEKSDRLLPMIEAQVVGDMLMALMFHQPQHPHISRWIDQAEKLISQTPDLNTRVSLAGSLLYYYGMMGEMIKATSLAKKIPDENLAVQVSPLMITLWKIPKAFYQWIYGELKLSFEDVAETRSTAKSFGFRYYDAWLYGVEVHRSLNKGNANRGERYLQKMIQVTHMERAHDRANYHFLRSWHALVAGHYADAFEQGKESIKASMDSGFPLFETFVRPLMAQALFELGKPSEAIEMVEASINLSRECHSKLYEVQGLLTKAQILLGVYAESKALEEVRHPEGLDSLRKAFLLMKESNIFNFPGFSRPIMKRLCFVALREEIEGKFVQEFARKMQISLKPTKRTSDHSMKNYGLTPRESEVLHWLTQGKSNLDIGNILDLSLKTVKKHLERIYRKLGVENRHAASTLSFKLSSKT
jgi:ATP/maltotriose-dependent transcriptional regulator MalT